MKPGYNWPVLNVKNQKKREENHNKQVTKQPIALTFNQYYRLNSM